MADNNLPHDRRGDHLLVSIMRQCRDDVLELDEVVSFFGEKWFKQWLWTAHCRRTRQIVAYAIGDRSQDTRRAMWQTVPTAYTVLLPPDQHVASRSDRPSGALVQHLTAVAWSLHP